MTAVSEPKVVPRPHHDDPKANNRQNNTQSHLCTPGEARVAGEHGVTRFAAGLLCCERACLQACEERIGSIIEDVHSGEREHRCVVIQCDLRIRVGMQLARGGTYDYYRRDPYLCLGPVAANVIKPVLDIWPADDRPVEDVSLLRRRGVDVVDVISAAGHGRVRVHG